ncbi:hypothetical protein VARIO8X_160090 [Burkholderiales bacterium 8X]|nr:hypothetical protein VARIO8X_160090 [Burkholderiales bacterium 8X]
MRCGGAALPRCAETTAGSERGAGLFPAGANNGKLPKAESACFPQSPGIPPDGRPYQRIEEPHGRTFDRLALAFLRPGVDPGKALFGHREFGHGALQPARQGWLAREAAIRVRARPDGGGAAFRDGEGLRVREGPLRDLPAGRTQGARRRRKPCDRDRDLHPGEGGRSDLLRQGLFPCARQARRQALQPAQGSDASKREMRARQVGLEVEAVRGAGACRRRRPGAPAIAVRGRGAFSQGPGDRETHAVTGRTQAGTAAHRPDLRRQLRADDVRGRGEEARAGRDRRQDRGQAHRCRGTCRGFADRRGHRPGRDAACQPLAHAGQGSREEGGRTRQGSARQGGRRHGEPAGRDRAQGRQAGAEDRGSQPATGARTSCQEVT